MPLGLQLTYTTGVHTLSHLRANAGTPTPAAVHRGEMGSTRWAALAHGVVSVVDGNDLYGSCPDPYPRLQAQLARRIALHFVREVDADRKATARWVRPPDLSARG